MFNKKKNRDSGRPPEPTGNTAPRRGEGTRAQRKAYLAEEARRAAHPEEFPKEEKRPAPAEEPRKAPRPQPEAPAEPRRAPRPQAEPSQEPRRPRPQAEAPQEPRRPRPQAEAPQEPRRPRPQTEAPQEPRRPRPQPEAPQEPRRPRPQAEAPQESRRPRPQAEPPQESRRPRPQAEAPQESRRHRPQAEASQEPRKAPRPKAEAPRMPSQAPRKPRKASREDVPRGYAKPKVDLLGKLKKKKQAPKGPPQGTSYQRSTPKPGTTFRDMFKKKEATTGRPSQAVARKAARAEEAEHKRKLALRFDTPAVVYTQPKAFNRNRLVVQLMTVLAVAVAFVTALSIFFKVDVITITGAETYSPWAIREASGIQEGDNLLTFSRARACGQIQANLSYVDKVRIGIKLPNTVNIEVEELDVAYSILADTGDWWLITSEGKVVDQVNNAGAENHTKVLGVKLDTPIIGEQGRAFEAPLDQTLPEGEEAPAIVTSAQKLNAALEILQALEDNDIVGEAASVNVGSLQQIELWYGQRYQVNLGDSTRLGYKIACMYDVILGMSDYQTGMLDISFQTISDKVVYTPFS